jgi:hypothetical protein
MNDKTINSSDASTGQPIVDRVMARKRELEALLASSPAEDARTQNDISTALNTVNALLSGDLSNVPAVVVADMNRWLEQNKHLAERSNPDASASTAGTDSPTNVPPDATAVGAKPTTAPDAPPALGSAWVPNS